MAKKKKKKNEIVTEAEAAKVSKKKAKKARKVREAERIDAPEPDEQPSRKSLDEGMEAIGKLVDHPLVADLVAAGAVAAVASLAEGQMTRARGTAGGSKETLKLAGRAAAAAMGKRFMAEMEAAKARRAANEPRDDGSSGDAEE
ncbi:hypothetical protein WJT74_07160 [Sphingomicrobium sp. XHP0239]|uniref:hypothetical protein n=1 Tax=Sphingomicrobium maritimum TaxID=3133972 RepID=UPI0031CC6CD0